MTPEERRDPEEHERFVTGKRVRRMAEIDNQPPAIRELVHEYGWLVVKTALDLGVTKPSHIRHFVETVLNEFSPTRGSYSCQGKRTEVFDHLKPMG